MWLGIGGGWLNRYGMGVVSFQCLGIIRCELRGVSMTVGLLDII